MSLALVVALIGLVLSLLLTAGQYPWVLRARDDLRAHSLAVEKRVVARVKEIVDSAGPSTLKNGIDPTEAAYKSHDSRDERKADKALRNEALAMSTIGKLLPKGADPSLATWAWDALVSEERKAMLAKASESGVVTWAKAWFEANSDTLTAYTERKVDTTPAPGSDIPPGGLY